MSLLVTPETPHKSQPLEDAFLAFNQISQHLTDSYQRLEQQVSLLGKELAQSNSEKSQYLSDKEALASQQEGLIEAIPGALVVLNAQHVVIKANACARYWLDDDIIGLSWGAVRTKHLISQDTFGDQFSLKSGQVVALSTTKLMGQSGYVVLLSDITQQQELYQQLEHKKKLAAMGEFSASLAHQVRTPLASALLYASQLNTDALSADAQQKFSAKLLESLRFLNSQVTDMLNYSHCGEFIKESITLERFIEHIKALYRDKAVDFQFADINKPALVYINKEALSGAVSNLLDNALDAIGYDARVTCNIGLDDINNLTIEVVDLGVGLTIEQQQRIFEPFYTNKTNGTGLGLAVVNEVVNAHAGEIKCLSTIGVGTTMELRLPVVASSIKKLNRSL